MQFSNARNEIEALEALRAQALIDGNVSALLAITAPDYIHVDIQGQRRSRADFIRSIETREVAISAYQVRDNEISLLGDAALVIGQFSNQRKDGDGMLWTQGRHVRVYAWRGDSWVNVLHQGTSVPSDLSITEAS